MAGLFERTIRTNDLEYRVVANFDDAAIMDNRLRLLVVGSVRKLSSGDWYEETIELVGNFERSVIELRVRGMPIAMVPLNVPLPDINDFLGNGSDLSVDDTHIDSALGTTAIETLIHLVPTDPFLGCIIKGAVSTVVGQTIRCWRTMPTEGRIQQRIRSIGNCLREYGMRMTLTFMYRAGRCAVVAELH
ncbi:MAG: hypothetical protein H8K07_21975 [Nitrospira sp.]|nr:hypothetical protein [Nitrospira sp.]MDI3463927.1 hypothetical protein [Nitrospira sp.]